MDNVSIACRIITRRQLVNLIKEALLVEYEQYVDEDGNVWDDEGNVTRRGRSFGRRYGGETYTGTRSPWSGRRRKTSYSPAVDNSGLISDIEKILSSGDTIKKWDQTFLDSVLAQLRRSRGLSDKQKPIVDRLVRKYLPTPQDNDPDTNDDGMLSVGELVDMTHDIVDDIKAESSERLTRDTLRRILREEISSILERSNNLFLEKASEHT